MKHSHRGWWGYVKWVIRDQPKKRRELEAIRSGGGLASDGTPRSTEARRTTEDRALRGFTGQKAREYDAVEAAAAETRTYASGALRLKLIDMVFWQRSHTLEGAAMACHISRRTAIRYHGDFIRLVAKKIGFDV